MAEGRKPSVGHRERRRLIVFLTELGCLVLCLVLSPLSAARGQDRVILGTATPGGGFTVYGKVFAEVINETDPSLHLEPRNTRGSAENLPLLEEGKLDIALVQGEVAHEAFRGPGSIPKAVKIICAMYPTAGMFAVRSDSPYRSIADLVGRPVVLGAKGSGLVLLARNVLEGIGLEADKDFTAIYLEKAGDGAAMVLDGRASALWGGGIGWPGFTTIARSESGARFLAPGPEEIERILAAYPFLQRLTIPAGSYPGQEAPIPSLGSWSFVLARASLPEDRAYRIARALYRSGAAMGKRLVQAKDTTLETTLVVAPSRDAIHPGVLRFMREVKLLH